MKKFFCVFLSVFVVASLLALGASAEDVFREVSGGGTRSAYAPEYSLNATGLSVFSSWVDSEGYSSSSPLYFSSPVYLIAGGHGAGSVEYVYSNNHILYARMGGTNYEIVSGLRSLGFDSADLYSWFLYTVGLDYSDFSYGSEVVSVVGVSQAIAGSVFDVGGSILSFVTSSWITVLALVSFVLVLGFGVIRKLVKGV